VNRIFTQILALPKFLSNLKLGTYEFILGKLMTFFLDNYADLYEFSDLRPHGISPRATFSRCYSLSYN